jgi:hypothetical protein
MNKTLIAGLLLVIAGCLVVQAQTHATAKTPAASVAQPLPVPPSFDIEMPVLHEPFDETAITPTETVGAARD